MPALLALTAAGFTGYSALLPVAPLWAVSGGANEAGAGFVNGMLMLATILTQPFVPTLLRRFGYGRVLAAGLLFLNGPALLHLVSHDLVWILGLSAVRGIGFGILTVTGSAAVANLVAPARRSDRSLRRLRCGAPVDPATRWALAGGGNRLLGGFRPCYGAATRHRRGAAAGPRIARREGGTLSCPARGPVNINGGDPRRGAGALPGQRPHSADGDPARRDACGRGADYVHAPNELFRRRNRRWAHPPHRDRGTEPLAARGPRR